jgi:hypothetical protein
MMSTLPASSPVTIRVAVSGFFPVPVDLTIVVRLVVSETLPPKSCFRMSARSLAAPFSTK